MFGSGIIPALKDAALEMRPRRVVLDDAHLSPDRITVVQQLRKEMEADFNVVAVSWPGRTSDVATRLPDAKRIDIEELERDRIVEVIEAAGVAGPEGLQRLIVDQARGAGGCAGAGLSVRRSRGSGVGREVARRSRRMVPADAGR